MDTLDFSRSHEITLKAKEGRLLNGLIDYARNDGVSIDYSGKEVVMEVWNQNRDVLIETYSVSGGEIVVSATQIVLDKIMEKTTLSRKKYYFQIYNDDDKIGIGHGPFEVL